MIAYLFDLDAILTCEIEVGNWIFNEECYPIFLHNFFFTFIGGF
jgi:hypothetical protein